MTAHLTWHGLADAEVDLDRIRAAGLSTVRFDVNWVGLEPADDAWNAGYLAQLDQIMDMIAARGLRPIIAFLNAPAWAQRDPSLYMNPPRNPKQAGEALGLLAARYAHHPHVAYETWNEPNSRAFWNTGRKKNAWQYVPLLRSAYARIKAADPDATVLAGGILFSDFAYLRDMYAAGAKGHFDALALHPYNHDHPPDWSEPRQEHLSFNVGVPEIIKIMAEHGDAAKPVWITEVGWSTQNVTEETRAAYYRRALELVRGWPQVTVFCAYTLNEAQFAGFGLIGPDGTPSATWVEYARLAAEDARRGGRPVEAP